MIKKRTRDNRNTPKSQACTAMSHSSEASRSAKEAPKSQTGNVRYSYVDCLRDKVPTPKGLNGTTLYQLLMTGFMVTFVFTANGVRTTGASFLAQSH